MKISSIVFIGVFLVVGHTPLVKGQTVEELYKQGLEADSKGDFDKATACWDTVLDLNPRDILAYCNRGKAEQENGHSNAAIADYTRALKINPKLALAYWGLGNIEHANGNWSAAINDYNRAIELDPKNAIVYSNRGDAKREKGDVTGALEDIGHAILLDPSSSLAYVNRGVVKGASGDLDAAIADFNQALALNPKLAGAYYNRGFAKQGKGNLDEAIIDYNRAIQLDSNVALAYKDRGSANALKGNWADAEKDLLKFCELSNKGQDYPHLIIWVMQTRLGASNSANKGLADYIDKRAVAVSDDWVAKVAGYLLGTISESDLFIAASSSDAKKSNGKMCEAWFYTGMKRFFAGDKKSAAEHFDKCIATDQKDFTEFQLAQSELKNLQR